MSQTARVAQARRTRRTSREAWSGDPPLRRAARERLLEAAGRCIAREGLAATGIAAVAAEAGVSRPTVYRYFDDRDDLVQGALLWAARSHAERVAGALQRLADPAAQAVEAVLLALRVIRADPVLREVWSSASLDAAAVKGFTGPLALALVRRAIASLVDAARWDEAQADECAEVMLRLTLSLLAAPGPERSTAELRRFLVRRLLPALALSTPAKARGRIPLRRPPKE